LVERGKVTFLKMLKNPKASGGKKGCKSSKKMEKKNTFAC
jgi:hypothetical protein